MPRWFGGIASVASRLMPTANTPLSRNCRARSGVRPSPVVPTTGGRIRRHAWLGKVDCLQMGRLRKRWSS